MLDNEAMIKLIELIKAVEEDNLELTKELVKYFNEATNIKNVPNINEHFNLNNIKKYINNESFMYVINNTVGINKRTKWEFKITQLKNNNNKDEIENFILDCLNNNQIELNNQYLASLIQLSTMINRYDLLNLISDKLKNNLD